MRRSHLTLSAENITLRISDMKSADLCIETARCHFLGLSKPPQIKAFNPNMSFYRRPVIALARPLLKRKVTHTALTN